MKLKVHGNYKDEMSRVDL